jgi:hypothetical protein
MPPPPAKNNANSRRTMEVVVIIYSTLLRAMLPYRSLTFYLYFSDNVVGEWVIMFVTIYGVSFGSFHHLFDTGLTSSPSIFPRGFASCS